MKFSLQISNKDLPDFGKNWEWLVGWGIGLLVLGCLAVAFATFTTILSVVLLGALILVGGIFVLIDAAQFWWQRSGFYLRLIMGLLYTFVGLMLIFGPAISSIALTLLLACLFILMGVSRIIAAVTLQYPRWKWSLISGIITLILGTLIIAEWPASGLFIIGFFIGIDLLLFGLAYIMLGLYAKNTANR